MRQPCKNLQKHSTKAKARDCSAEHGLLESRSGRNISEWDIIISSQAKMAHPFRLHVGLSPFRGSPEMAVQPSTFNQEWPITFDARDSQSQDHGRARKPYINTSFHSNEQVARNQAHPFIQTFRVISVSFTKSCKRKPATEFLDKDLHGDQNYLDTNHQKQKFEMNLQL